MAAQGTDKIAASRLGIVGSLTIDDIKDYIGTGSDPDVVADIAAGSTLGLQQQLLADAGQPALTVLVAGPTSTGKLQGTSLGDGNVVEVYASGNDFNNGTVLYREFMSLGEPICFTGLSFGAIVTATKGFYGFTEVQGPSATAAQQGIMPLMSFGLSFKETFLFAFRNSTGNSNDRGLIFVANGPLSNTIKLTDGNGIVQRSQENIELQPWETTYLDTNGNKEYILSGTEKMMACILSRGGGTAINGSTRPALDYTILDNGNIWDCRLVLPVNGDFIGNPRSGFVSAPYDNTVFKWYDRQGDEGSFTVSPGSPVDADSGAGTSNSQGDHNPAGYTRFLVTGLGTAHSGADGQGGDAVQMASVSSLSQVVAQPLRLPDSGQGDETGITIFSPFVGTAKIFEYNTTTGLLDLAYTLQITRDSSVTILSKQDQYHPCAVSLSNTTGNVNNVVLNGELLPGIIIADVPIGVIIQAQNGVVSNMRSQNGTTVASIYTQEDETAMYGWTPETLKAEIREGSDGILYKRVIGANGTDSWVVA